MLELYNVTKVYQQKAVFKELNLKVDGPVLLGVNGVSGVGKTTLLNIIGGIEEDYQGAVRFNGINIKKDRDSYRLHHVCFLYQQYALLSKWSIKNNLNLYSYLSHQKSNINEAELLEKLNLHEKSNKPCGVLSGGQQQRYALIRGLKKEPAIILCDEPTSALDQENAQRLMALLKELSSSAIVIVVSHDHTLLNQYCDKVIHLHEGQIDTTRIASYNRLVKQSKKKKRLIITDYLILLKEMFKSQKERHLLSVFAIMFGTVCLMVSLIISYCLKQETFKEIKKLFPQQCISLKYQNDDWLDVSDATTLIESNPNVTGAYLHLPYVEFLGLGKEAGDVFFIGDNTRGIDDDIRLSYGRFPEHEQEILLSKNTYLRLFGEIEETQTIYGYYQYTNEQKRASLQVVGVVDEYTTMDTMYQLSLGETKIVQSLFNLSEVKGDYLMLYCKGDIVNVLSSYREQFSQYEYKEVGADFSAKIESILEKVSYFLYALTFIMLISIGMLLIMSIYLNITEKLKEIGLFRMMGASKKQIILLQLLDIFLMAMIGSMLGVLLIGKILEQCNFILKDSLGFTLITNLPWLWQVSIILAMSGLGLLSSLFPIALLSRLSLNDCLKDMGY